MRLFENLFDTVYKMDWGKVVPLKTNDNKSRKGNDVCIIERTPVSHELHPGENRTRICPVIIDLYPKPPAQE